jgi:glyoxylase-like metal-dependent hydrolase (beta-lactamase superfamily II)
MLIGAQSYDPMVETGPIDIQPAKFQVIYDLEQNRFIREQEDHFPTDYVYTYRIILNPTQVIVLNLDKTFVGPLADTSLTSALASTRAQLWREVPSLLLLQSERRAAGLRYLGRTRSGSVSPQDVVSAIDEGGAAVTLYFDATSHLLTRSEVMRDDPIRGDLVSALQYRDYRNVEGIQLHTRRTEIRNGSVFTDGAVTALLDRPVADTLFQVPAGFSTMSLPGPEAEPVRNLGGGVYLAQETPDQNRVMFVAFRDYVLVVEAPSGSAVSEGTIKLIEKTLPGKPIRYVTMTHHHQDHAAGLRAYIARGITVVTTPGNREFVKRLAAAEHTLAPDSLSRAPRSPVIETFQGKRVFTDGDQTVELYDIGKNSHVREMLFAYLPKRRMVYQGDPLILPAYGTDVPPALALTREFAADLKRLRLPVDTILNTHGRVGTMQDLNASLARVSAAR